MPQTPPTITVNVSVKSNIMPSVINILGVPYAVEYFDNPSEVDPQKRRALWGNIDYWGRKINIYNNNRPPEDIFQVILHEILHAICDHLYIKAIQDAPNADEVIDTLATALADTLIRNNMVAPYKYNYDREEE